MYGNSNLRIKFDVCKVPRNATLTKVAVLRVIVHGNRAEGPVLNRLSVGINAAGGDCP